MLASATHLITFGQVATTAAKFGATSPVGVTLVGAFIFEFILTFVLMFVVIAVATDARVVCGIGGFAIGMAVSIDCLAAGKCCGASMNPARSLGPAVFAGGEAIAHLWLYICAPVIGAIAATYAYEFLRRTKTELQAPVNT